MKYSVWKVTYTPVTMLLGTGAKRTQNFVAPRDLSYEDVCQAVRKHLMGQTRENDQQNVGTLNSSAYVGLEIHTVKFLSLADELVRG